MMREIVKIWLLLVIAAAVAALAGQVRGIHHDLTMANCIALAKSGVTCADPKP